MLPKSGALVDLGQWSLNNMGPYIGRCSIYNLDKVPLSFIVIAHNEEKRIATTLESLLAQDTLIKFEIIVIDDGSSDGTVRVSEEALAIFPRNQIISFNTNQGRGAARLEGQNRARGSFLAFIDSDVTLPSNWVEKTLSTIESENLDAVSGVAIPDGDCVVIGRIGRLDPRIRGGSAALTGNNMLIRRDAITQVPFQNLPYGDDIRLAWDLERKGFKTKSIVDLVVTHSESKSFKRTVIWQYQQGKEATSLLWDYRKLRIPDFAWFGSLILFIISLYSFSNNIFLPLLIASETIYSLLVSILFLYSRFNLRVLNVRSYMAIGVNLVFMASYFVGRYRGLVSINFRQRG